MSSTQILCSSRNVKKGYRAVGVPGQDHVIAEGGLWRCGFLDTHKVQCDFRRSSMAAVMWHYNQEHEQATCNVLVADKPVRNPNRKRKSSDS